MSPAPEAVEIPGLDKTWCYLPGLTLLGRDTRHRAEIDGCQTGRLIWFVEKIVTEIGEEDVYRRGSQSREWPAVWLSLVLHWYRFTEQRMASSVAILGPALVQVHRAEDGQLYGYPWSCTGTGSQSREWPVVWLSLVQYWYRFIEQRMTSGVAILGPALVQVHRAENGQ
ncbi:hypothetical protein RRG08_062616 [Elysia crispata]|uniref:Uncharacterized protein n=1 Tax=Elysia crispata TaxID=231223 RepID=A0AAE0YY78_9GAST|nr:hypothetical protein RRG08_062616 [Elysia crispata]